MTLFQGAFLGLLQGLTEFLPVSSSGHLALFEILFGLKEANLFFNVMVHLGTLVAVVCFFWKDLWMLIKDTVSGLLSLGRGTSWSEVDAAYPSLKLAGLLIVATIPTGIMGIFFKEHFESMFGSLRAIGFAFLITTVLVWVTQFFGKGNLDGREMGPVKAFCIGILQGIAITPGISRSGSTISMAMMLGVGRQAAARFSFLLSIPAILGASVLEFKDLSLEGINPSIVLPTIVGAVIAAGVGYLAIKLLMGILERGHFHLFAYYTLALGVLTLVLSF
jgi:undecaprenyl-diphosphatase